MKTRLPAALLPLALLAPLYSDDTVPPPLLEFASGLPGKQVRLTWPAEPGVRYRIERSTELGDWSQLAMIEATGAEGSWRDPETTKTKAFYRITQPGAEVFSIPEPVLSVTGGEIFIRGQRIPAGSKLVLSVDGVETEFALESMGAGLWRAIISGAFAPGSHVVAVAIKSPAGVTLVPLGQALAVTLTGRTLDSPPPLPPAAPYRGGQTNVLARYPVVAAFAGKKGYDYYNTCQDNASGSLIAAWLSKKGYDHYNAHSDFSSGQEGPAGLRKRGYDYYQAQSDMAAAGINTNPLYQGSGTHGTNPLHKGRIAPSSTGLPGEVSFHHVSLDLPCPAGPPLAWVATYRSKLPIQSGLGSGWDYSYNISIEPIPLAAGSSAPRLIVRDGGGRADTFLRQADGTYRCSGMFREGRFENGIFTLTFANGGRWVFRALDGSPGAGKIASIVDRNQVALGCSYDSSGLLSRVSDSFGRSLLVEWGGSPSRIASVTAQDAAGTTSYQKIEFDYLHSGSRLMSISSPHEPGSPAVAGPDSFTYSEGLSDPNLNGNLLTVRDGAGRLLDAFEYATATDPADPAYDTCAAQDRHRSSAAGHQLRTTFAVLLSGGYEVCENDELGRVTVSAFDKLHRLLRVRQYTGFATPGAPVSSSNLPSPATKLRPGDPDYFETSFSYNTDSLCTRITYPDGSREETVYDRDFRKDCPVREQGNARVVSWVSSSGETRTVTCGYLSGFGSPEAARPGNPIKGISVKCGRPGGSSSSSLVWSPRSNFTGVDDDETPDCNSVLAKSGVDGGMPNRISMNVTTPRQTQGSTFGERMAAPRDSSSGLATGRRQHSPLAPSGSSGGDIPCVSSSDACFVTRIVTAHGQGSSSSYDAHGNLIGETGPIPGLGAEYGYNARGQVTSTTVLNGQGSSFEEAIEYGTKGFPLSVTLDPGGLALTTSFGHDDLGRLVSVTDPLAHTWAYGHDVSGNLVSVTSPPAPASITTTAALDAAGCVARIDVAHLGADGKPVAENPAYSTFFVRDNRASLIRIAEEERPVDASGVLVPDSLGLENFGVVDFISDEAGQTVRLSTPAGSRGQTGDLVSEFTYDERGLVHRVIEGGAAASAPLITATDYDTCGAPVRITSVANGLPQPVTLVTWDGFHRLSSVTDPMGNVSSLEYDNQGFVTTSISGEVLDQPGSASNVLLYRSHERWGGASLRAFNQNASRSNHTRLAFNQNSSRSNNMEARAFNQNASRSNHTRAFNQNASRSNHTRAFNQNASRSNHTRLGLTEDLFFDVFSPDDTLIEERFTAGSSAQPVRETTVIQRSPAGLPRAVTRNGDSLLTLTYDSAGRLSSYSDGATSTALARDGNGKVLVCGNTDHFLVAGVPDKTFTTTRAYDALGRCVSLVDGIGNSTGFAWDSLDRCTSISEPGGLLVQIAYDGGSASGAFSHRFSADVDGDGKPDVLSSALVRCGEALHLDDSYGHRTSFTRDSLGRVIGCDFPDSTYETTTFDALGRAASHRRKNGAVIACDFNLRGEVVSISHTLLPEEVVPVGTTTFSYNGLGDCVRCEQGSSLIQWTWDSLGNPLGETQGGRTISRTYDHRGRTGIVYPDGTRFAETRDALGRVLSVSSLDAVGLPVSPPVMVLQYAGERVWRSTQANGVVTTYSYRGDGPPAQLGSPDFSFDACVETTVTGLLAHELAHTVQQRDRNQRVVSRQTRFTSSPQGPGRFQVLTRDVLGRISSSMTRRREAAGGAPVVEESVSYIYGKEGHRVQEIRNGVTGDYNQDPTLPPGDQQMDQYTSWPGGPLDWDEEGNLRSIHRGSVMHACQYDAEGRLVSVTDPTGGGTLVSYGYDAIGRRISRSTGGNGTPPMTTEFVYDGGACLQEWGDNGSGSMSASLSFVVGDGTTYRVTGGSGSHFYPVTQAARTYSGRKCTCPDGYFYSSSRNKVQHWGDPHENMNGRVCPGGGRVWPQSGYVELVTSEAALVTERFDRDDAGKPVFLTSEGIPTGSSSPVGPIRWMAPEAMWESSIGMLLGSDAIYCPDLGMMVGRVNGHVTVLKAAATSGGGVSGGSRVQDHNSSRSNKSSS